MPEYTEHIVVRPAGPEDAVPACQVLRHSISTDRPPFLDPDDASSCDELGERAPERVRTWIESPENFSVVAEGEDRHVIGFSLIQRDGTLKLCYVLTGAHSHGAGTAMLRALEHHAFDIWKVDAITLSATTEAAHFYISHGYSIRHEAPGGVGTIQLAKPRL